MFKYSIYYLTIWCQEQRPGAHDHAALLREAQTMLGDRFAIRHSTIQIDRDVSCGGTALAASAEARHS